MKNYLVALFFMILLTSCNSGNNKNKVSESFTINGEVTGIADQKIYLKLEAVEDTTVQEFEPVQIVNGQFQFKGQIINPPAIVSFDFEDSKIELWEQFIIDNLNMTLSIRKDKTDQDNYPVFDTKLQGSAMHDQYATFMNNLLKINEEARGSAAIYRTLGNNGKLPKDQWSEEDLAQFKKLEKINKEAKINQDNYLLNAVNSGNDLLKLLAIPNLFHWNMKPFNSYEHCESVFNKLDTSLKASHVRQYYSSEIFKKSEQIRLASEVTIGKTYKDFSQNDQNGKLVTASNILKSNKYVLFDFWASWCGPCRKENPNLLKAYNKYHNKGFDVLAISIDHDKEAWLKAIKKDGMPWTQVSDLKGRHNTVAKLYSVTGVPSSFLINSEGTIVSIDLRGEALHKKLEELLK